MSVQVTFECSGCFEKSKPGIIRREFHSITGKPYGFGSYKVQDIQDIAPEGWIAFDPYTQCCYCPKCWAEIEAA